MRSLLIPPLVMSVMVGCQNKTDSAALVDVGFSVSGVILEKLDAAPDSYLRLQTDQGDVWAKVPMTDLDEGSSVKIVRVQEMRQWESSKLQRMFDRLYLGQLETQRQTISPETIHGGAVGVPQSMAAIGQMGESGVPVSAVNLKLDRAPGADGRTVAEIVSNGLSLKDKTVTVRGQVVKVTSGLKVPNIVGGTWIHIQDGTGDQAKGTNDLTVATDEVVNVGDILVLQGKVTIDDSGFLGGRVILQNTKVVKAKL
ncbi:MAG: hypothetical protein LBH03_05445 [Holophagales bacterium]|jgi:hypothetical protein|nr:hypothetical protein [Holophagales bacterium]